MKTKKKSSPDQHPESPPKKHQDGNSDNVNPNSDDPNEETKPPLKEIPINGGPHHPLHPHREEILD